MNDPLGDIRPVQRHTVKEAQRTDRLVQRRPGNPPRCEINLKRPGVLKPQPIRRTAKITTELCDGIQIRLLRRPVTGCELSCRRSYDDAADLPLAWYLPWDGLLVRGRS